MILFDTDHVVDCFRGRPDTVDLVNVLHENEGVAVSAVSVGEFYEGVFLGRDPDIAERSLLRWLGLVTVLPVDEHVARSFGRLRGGLRLQGMLIPDADLLIAAALHHDLTLVSRNRRHFARAPGSGSIRPDQSPT